MTTLNAAASSLLMFSLYAAGTGLAAAAFNQGIQWVRDRSRRDRAAADFILKCAASLETFTHSSLDLASDIDAALAMGQNPSEVICKLGTLAPYPDMLDGWLGIRKGEAALLINLRLKLENDSRAVTANSWHEAPPDAVALYRDANILAAADAWSLARRLRAAHGLPVHGKIDARDPEDFTTYYLEHELNAIHAREEARLKARVDVVRSFESNSKSLSEQPT